MTNEETLKLALEALERVNNVDDDCDILSRDLANFVVDTIDAVKEALASEQEQRSDSEHTGEPVAWMEPDWADGTIFRDSEVNKTTDFFHDHMIPLYTTPQQRKPLTDEQIEAIARENDVWLLFRSLAIFDFVRAIEAAHGIKGEA